MQMHPLKEDALKYEGGQRGCSGVKRISNLHHFDLLGRYIGCLPNNEYQDDDAQKAKVFFILETRMGIFPIQSRTSRRDKNF